jgi:hypothetical protein
MCCRGVEGVAGVAGKVLQNGPPCIEALASSRFLTLAGDPKLPDSSAARDSEISNSAP